MKTSRSVRFAAALLCLSAVGCGAAAPPSAPPFTLAQAKRPFLARSFIVGCPNLAPLKGGAVHDLNIGLRDEVSGGRLCNGTPGTLTVYGNAAEAHRACKQKDYFCGGPAYAVRNVVVAIDPRIPKIVRARMMSAIRALGPPTRIA